MNAVSASDRVGERERFAGRIVVHTNRVSLPGFFGLVLLLATALLAGCSTRTVCFGGAAIDDVKEAYAELFRQKPMTTAQKEEMRPWIKMADGIGETIGQAERSAGIWRDYKDTGWRGNRYEKAYSRWWLIFPLESNSEFATVLEVEGGVEFKLEISPANEAKLNERMENMRNNLRQLGWSGPDPLSSTGK
jgi:hypothetical protein